MSDPRRPGIETLSESLISQLCPVCKGTKRPGETFCGACYFRLDRQTRRHLYTRLGPDYELSFAEACEALEAVPSFTKHTRLGARS